MERLTAHYRRHDDLLWKAFVEESPEIHVAGRSLTAVHDQLRSTIVEHGYSDPEIIDLVDLPERSRHLVEAAAAARKVAAEATERSVEVTSRAARSLVEDGLSLRDTAKVLGLSHTRVQQLLRPQTWASAVSGS